MKEQNSRFTRIGKGMVSGMSIMEISLLILGVAIFAASFIIPEWKKYGKDDSIEISDELIKKMIDKQMDETQKRLEGVVDETLEYAVEKTERAAERISNEKIMAVSEYSDTVLEEINKNHKEVMFLYDMLNDKHKNITTAAMEVDKKAKAAEETAKEAEEKALAAKKQVESVQEQVKGEKTVPTVSMPKEEKQPATKPLSAIDILRSRQRQAADNMIEVLGAKRIERPANLPKKQQATPASQEEHAVSAAKAGQAVTQTTQTKPQTNKPQAEKSDSEQFRTLDAKPVTGQEHILEQYVSAAKEQNKEMNKIKEPAAEALQGNNNDKILLLHKEGKSNVAIAKELGLGVGEVSLVLNLYKGA